MHFYSKVFLATFAGFVAGAAMMGNGANKGAGNHAVSQSKSTVGDKPDVLLSAPVAQETTLSCLDAMSRLRATTDRPTT